MVKSICNRYPHTSEVVFSLGITAMFLFAAFQFYMLQNGKQNLITWEFPVVACLAGSIFFAFLSMVGFFAIQNDEGVVMGSLGLAAVFLPWCWFVSDYAPMHGVSPLTITRYVAIGTIIAAIAILWAYAVSFAAHRQWRKAIASCLMSMSVIILASGLVLLIS